MHDNPLPSYTPYLVNITGNPWVLSAVPVQKPLPGGAGTGNLVGSQFLTLGIVRGPSISNSDSAHTTPIMSTDRLLITSLVALT